jgi:arylsulfatase A-like enzyme
VESCSTAVVYGAVAGIADFLRVGLFEGLGWRTAILVGCRSSGYASVLAGLSALALTLVLWELDRLRPGLLSLPQEMAALIGAGAVPLVAVWVHEGDNNGYSVLVKTVLIGGAAAVALYVLSWRALRPEQRTDRALAMLPRLCPWGMAAIIALSVLSTLGPWHSAAGAKAAGGKGATGPNILLVIMDSARADHFSLYGYRVKTSPFLERLAAESTVFDNAIAASSWTLPSHATIFTGLSPGRHNTHAEHFWLDDRYPTLAGMLGDAGYQTVVFSNNDYVSQDTNLVKGFQRFWYKGRWADDARYSVPSLGRAADLLLQSFSSAWEAGVSMRLAKNPAAYVDYPSAAVTNRAIEEWLEKERDAQRPFFLSVTYMDVHFPYNPSDEIAKLFLDEAALGRSYALRLRRPPIDYDLDVSKGHYSPDELRIINALYDADVRSMDGELEKLCAKLQALGLYNRTAIIITSDHGEYLGTHNRFAHGLGLNEEVLHVPLLARYPGVFAAGARVGTVVTFPDLFDTVLALAKVEERPKGVTGTEKLFQVPASDLRCAFSEFRFPMHLLLTARLRDDNAGLLVEQRAVRDRTHKLIWKSRGALEFYDLASDPLEMKNLYTADNEQAQAIERELFEWMHSDIPQVPSGPEDRRLSPKENTRSIIERLRTLGYVK